MKKKGKFITLVTLPVLMQVVGIARADDMMSTYQLAVQQDQQYQAAVSVYEAE